MTMYLLKNLNLSFSSLFQLIVLTEACASREVCRVDYCSCNPWSKRSLDIISGFFFFNLKANFSRLIYMWINYLLK